MFIVGGKSSEDFTKSNDYFFLKSYLDFCRNKVEIIFKRSTAKAFRYEPPVIALSIFSLTYISSNMTRWRICPN
jgi:hypothetical protein